MDIDIETEIKIYRYSYRYRHVGLLLITFSMFREEDAKDSACEWTHRHTRSLKFQVHKCA